MTFIQWISLVCYVLFWSVILATLLGFVYSILTKKREPASKPKPKKNEQLESMVAKSISLLQSRILRIYSEFGRVEVDYHVSVLSDSAPEIYELALMIFLHERERWIMSRWHVFEGKAIEPALLCALSDIEKELSTLRSQIPIKGVAKVTGGAGGASDAPC